MGTGLGRTAGCDGSPTAFLGRMADPYNRDQDGGRPVGAEVRTAGTEGRQQLFRRSDATATLGETSAPAVYTI